MRKTLHAVLAVLLIGQSILAETHKRPTRATDSPGKIVQVEQTVSRVEKRLDLLQNEVAALRDSMESVSGRLLPLESASRPGKATSPVSALFSFLLHVLIPVLVSGAASLAVTYYYDRATSPSLEVVPDDGPRAPEQRPDHPRHQFLQIKARQKRASWPFGTRRPAWRTRATMEVFDSAGRREFGSIVARWSGSLLPYRTQVIGGEPARVPDSSLIPLGQCFDVHSNVEEQIDVAVKYEGRAECWIFSNESYLHDDWTKPDWKLGCGEYYIQLQLHYESRHGRPATQWLVLKNTGRGLEDWSVSLTSAPSWPPVPKA
jgi:hypothetical protein